MLALSNENTPLDLDSDELEEAVRRYRLPFGIAGKHSTYKKARETDFPKKVRSLVVQDFRVLTPAEYIFGLSPGDCVSMTVDVLKYRPEYTSQIDYLTKTFTPSFVVISAINHEKFSPHTLQDFAASVSRNVLGLKKRLKQKSCEVRTCVVDERARDVIFL